MSADEKKRIRFHNTMYRMAMDEPESRETVVRLTAPEEVYARRVPNTPTSLVDVNLHDSLGREFRADAIVELLLNSEIEVGKVYESYYLYEHKSYDDRGDVLQGNINRLVFQLRQLRKDPESGKVPLVFVIVFMHGPGVTDRPDNVRDMVDAPPELAHLAEELGGRVIRFDASQITLKVLPKDPTKGAALLVLARSHKQRLTDEEAVYAIRGLARSLDRDFFIRYVLAWCRLPWARVKALLEEQIGKVEAKKRMDTLGDQFRKDGKQLGAVDMLLGQLRTKFKRVPRERQRQIRSASVEQIMAWGKRLVLATSIDAVFEG